jgi:hypothetical protein
LIVSKDFLYKSSVLNVATNVFCWIKVATWWLKKPESTFQWTENIQLDLQIVQVSTKNLRTLSSPWIWLYLGQFMCFAFARYCSERYVVTESEANFKNLLFCLRDIFIFTGFVKIKFISALPKCFDCSIWQSKINRWKRLNLL